MVAINKLNNSQERTQSTTEQSTENHGLLIHYLEKFWLISLTCFGNGFQNENHVKLALNFQSFNCIYRT